MTMTVETAAPKRHVGGGPRSPSHVVELIDQPGGCEVDVGASAGDDGPGRLDERRVIPVIAAVLDGRRPHAVALALLAGERVAREAVLA
jgi:hypothetical protein